MASLSGKTAIVTGASSGIGAATARALRDAGARVAGGARRVDAIEADLALELDVTDPESCAAFVARAADEFGGIDILVNNAGLALGRNPFAESTEEDERTVIETNVNGVIRMKMRKEDTVNGERIEARPKHAADSPRAKVEDQCLSAGTYHDATLSPLQTRDYSTGSHDRDLHGPPFGRKLSAVSFQLRANGAN